MAARALHNLICHRRHGSRVTNASKSLGAPRTRSCIRFVSGISDEFERSVQLSSSSTTRRRLAYRARYLPKLDGWVTLLETRYTRSADVITRGLSGYNTKWFLKYVMPVLEREIRTGAYTPPSLITVWLGTNDAALTNGSNLEMHVPLEDYKGNLIKIVEGFRSTAPVAKILLITPPHIDDGTRAKFAATRTDAKRGLVDRSNAAVANYSRACVEVADTLKIPVLDLYAYFNAMSAETRNAMLVDGIHFNAAGNKVVDEQLRTKLSTEFPSLANTLETWQFPAVSKYVTEDPWTPRNTTDITPFDRR